MRLNSGLCVVLLGLVAAGCGGSSGSSDDLPGDGGSPLFTIPGEASVGSDATSAFGPEGGSILDGSVGIDSGSGLDSGFGVESGSTLDRSSGQDSAPGLDAGAGPDSSPGPDAGAGPDSGSVKDGGSAADSSSPDSSAGADSGAAPDSSTGQDSGLMAAGVHAVGNQIYDGSKAIRLLGVDRPGTEYECGNGDGIFDGPNDQASITAMLTWDINAVRIPLNEDCWLSLNGVSASYSGANYQSAIGAYVTLLLGNGIYPILDLHWTEDAGAKATGQQPMPDANATAFWTSVAGMFKSQNKVIFDLFNEPYPDMNMDATSAWQCWGSTTSTTCPGVSYEIVGMKGMLAAVRNAGANNFVVLGGIEYSNDLSQWLAYAPTDTNIGVSWHVYTNSNYTSSHSLSSDAAPVLAKVPIVATEIGDYSTPPACNGQFITTVMDYLDAPGAGIPAQSYLAWSWSTDNTPHVISDYTGTPTCDGATYKMHLMAQQ